ncbi:MAG: T9SS type A sorting domain-containing protein [Flavobacteriales bacterium]|nr:T9SS type A sorting domain-containing protein [Flavobacteriales bacterium]
MKALFFSFLSSCISLQLCAQGIITGINVVPPYPTETDDIEIHVNLEFSSGGCEVDNQGAGVNGTTITAYAHHCLGMLTYICNATDIYQIGQLQAGNYTFNMTLSSGFGGPGCSPGIVPDDNDQLQFTVSTTVGIDGMEPNETLFFPNPVEEQLNFNEPLKEAAVLLNLTGQMVKSVPAGARVIDVSDLESGIYFLNVSGKKIRVLRN